MISSRLAFYASAVAHSASIGFSSSAADTGTTFSELVSMPGISSEISGRGT